jgi:phosphoserine aminotransferase
MTKPQRRPANPNFSSGPCAKRPGYAVTALQNAAFGRSHRSKLGKAKLKDVVQRSRTLLGMPKDYRLGIVPASDTGAVEMILWSLLGPRPVDALTWESFGEGWVTDIEKQLKIKDLRVMRAPYGQIPDLAKVDTDHDVVFPWNGTTSGARIPNGDWIKADRQGLTICDATSAAFAMDLVWEKLDVVTWSWQKALGGEAAHGMLALSPRAVERLESYTPPWPLPKIFRLTSKGKLIEGIFKGETINTPSMLCVEDALDSLRWAESVGGLRGLIARSEANLAAIAAWVEGADWIDFLAEDPETRSCTSVCLKLTAPWVAALPTEAQWAVAKRIAALLEGEGVAYAIAAHRDSPPGLRIWTGATIETSNVVALLPWLDWAYATAAAEHAPARAAE